MTQNIFLYYTSYWRQLWRRCKKKDFPLTVPACLTFARCVRDPSRPRTLKSSASRAWASPMRRQHSTGQAAHTARSSQCGCLGPEGTSPSGFLSATSHRHQWATGGATAARGRPCRKARFTPPLRSRCFTYWQCSKFFRHSSWNPWTRAGRISRQLRTYALQRILHLKPQSRWPRQSAGAWATWWCSTDICGWHSLSLRMKTGGCCSMLPYLHPASLETQWRVSRSASWGHRNAPERWVTSCHAGLRDSLQHIADPHLLPTGHQRRRKARRSHEVPLAVAGDYDIICVVYVQNAIKSVAPSQKEPFSPPPAIAASRSAMKWLIKPGRQLPRVPSAPGEVPNPLHDMHVRVVHTFSSITKRAIEAVPPSERERGYYSRYFVVPKKDGGLRPILDLRPINRALYKRAFKMTMLKQILAQIRPRD